MQKINGLVERSKIDASPILYGLFFAVILLTCLTFLIPDTIFSSIDGSAIAEIVPKVTNDFDYLKLHHGSAVANRYLFVFTLCVLLFVPITIFAIIYASDGVRLRGQETLRPRSMQPSMQRLLLRLLSVIFISYFLFFEQWIAGSTTGRERAIYDSQLFVVFVPLLFVAFVNTVQLTAQDFMRECFPRKTRIEN